MNFLLLSVRKLNNAPARQKKMELCSQNRHQWCIMNNKFINYKLEKQKNNTKVFSSDSITGVHLYTVWVMKTSHDIFAYILVNSAA